MRQASSISPEFTLHVSGMATQFRPYQPETITRALVNLRAQLIRDGGQGLAGC
jgi:hypothetical protein